MLHYGRRARARVALSVAARDVSDAARALVPSPAEEPLQGGDLVERASRLAGRAHELLELAVIVERERGTSWEAMGRALGVSRQAVHERFSAAVGRWKEGLREPWAVEPGSRQVAGRLPLGAEDVAAWAERLDEWVTQRRGPTDPDPGNHPVSANLPRAGERELERMYLEQLTILTQRLSAPGAGELHPDTRRGLQQHRVELLERLAALRPNAPAYAEAAAYARHQLAAISTRSAGTRKR